MPIVRDLPPRPRLQTGVLALEGGKGPRTRGGADKRGGRRGLGRQRRGNLPSARASSGALAAFPPAMEGEVPAEVFEKVMEHCLSDSMVDEIEGFARKHCAAFSLEDGSAGSEQKLECAMARKRPRRNPQSRTHSRAEHKCHGTGIWSSTTR